MQRQIIGRKVRSKNCGLMKRDHDSKEDTTEFPSSVFGWSLPQVDFYKVRNFHDVASLDFDDRVISVE